MNFRLIDANGAPVISLPKGYDLVEVLIGTNLQDENENGEWLLDALDEVLTGKVSHSTVGDVRYVVLNLNKTSVKITDPYSVDESKCVVETSVFKKLIIEWLRKKREYYNLR
jgi:hypothetical protein